MTPALPVTSKTARIALPILLFGAALSLMTLRSNASATPAGSSQGQAALRVQIDPETGALVPVEGNQSARGALSPESALSHSLQGLRVEVGLDGSLHVDLQNRFMESMVATTDVDGQTHLGCLPSGQAERAVLTPTTAPTGAVER